MVHAADDPVSAAFPSGAEQRIRYAFAQPAPDSVGEIDGFIAARVHTGPAVPIVHRDALVMLGDFQRENVMAASAAAMALGAGPQAVGLAMACARPLPFRLQLIAAVDGVRIYDNGVSTEIESTRSALRALTGRIHWVGGGKSKDGDFQTVADGVADHVASAHVFGAAAEPMWRCLQGRVATTRNDRVQQALAAAMAAARRGDAILFSPAFASFDQYPNFRVRALEFHRWVAERRSGGANAAATTA
jgi:UDP-N-acetylmuramoylalanine--D-glutamate ligase